MLESIREFCYLLEIDPLWIVILIMALVMKAFVPWRLEYKVEETEEKETGKKTYKIFQLEDK